MFAPYYYALNWIDIIFPAWRDIGISQAEIDKDDEALVLLWYFLEMM